MNPEIEAGTTPADQIQNNIDTWAEHPERALLGLNRFDASTLMSVPLPPVEELVKGLIQTGLVLLVAAPKIGKSWLALSLAYVAAKGQHAFGAIKVAQRPTLYMALEDGPRRLQNRLSSLGFTEPYPRNLEFIVRLDPGVTIETAVREFCEDHAEEQPFVILDTLGKYKVQAPRRTGETDYERDYRLLGSLCELIHEYDGATLLIVHHTRKTGEGDFLDSVSGTNGVAGAADAILKLDRRRGSDEGTLQVTSRDGPEGDYLMHFSSAGQWTLDGDSLEKAAEAAKEYRQTATVGDLMGDVIRVVNSHPDGVTPKDVAEELKERGVDNQSAGKYLTRAAEAGRVSRVKRGVYGPISH